MMMQEWFSEGFPVQVPAGTSILDAEMQVPSGATGFIILAHAGSRPRYTQRVQNMAECFAKNGFGILVMDLLTEEESEIGKQALEFSSLDENGTCFDSEMLAERLDSTVEWVLDLPEAAGLPIGLFGTGTGAWAALATAAARPTQVAALVAVGLPTPSDFRNPGRIRAPTLIISGDQEDADSGLFRECFAAIPGRKRIEFISGYAKGREEVPMTEKISRLACHWFEQYLE
ncbi:MAG: dienelactone hydrolase family protein [Fibrobacterota bacterium]|nr:dienelactone hydrolase family protein [Fibrobacterota bacterium]